MLVSNFHLVGDWVRHCEFLPRNLPCTSEQCPVPASHLLVETLDFQLSGFVNTLTMANVMEIWEEMHRDVPVS